MLPGPRLRSPALNICQIRGGGLWKSLTGKIPIVGMKLLNLNGTRWFSTFSEKEKVSNYLTYDRKFYLNKNLSFGNKTGNNQNVGQVTNQPQPQQQGLRWGNPRKSDCSLLCITWFKLVYQDGSGVQKSAEAWPGVWTCFMIAQIK